MEIILSFIAGVVLAGVGAFVWLRSVRSAEVAKLESDLEHAKADVEQAKAEVGRAQEEADKRIREMDARHEKDIKAER